MFKLDCTSWSVTLALFGKMTLVISGVFAQNWFWPVNQFWRSTRTNQLKIEKVHSMDIDVWRFYYKARSNRLGRIRRLSDKENSNLWFLKMTLCTSHSDVFEVEKTIKDITHEIKK